MDIKDIVEKYKAEDPKLFEYIGRLVYKKAQEGKWDKGIDDESEDLTQMLIYEYATSLEKITKGKVSAKFVVDKLSSQMGKMRYGEYKKGLDEDVTYDNVPVTSKEYTEMCRVKSNFGAHAPTYMEDGKEKCAIVLFDNSQQYDYNGKPVTLTGIDLSNLSDVRGTAFHEWSHIMEKCFIKASDLKKEDIIYKEGESTYINACLSPDLTMEEYKDYIANVDNLLQSDEEVMFGGISTIEINERKSPNRRIMHNQISEGATELLSRLVMKEVGDEVIDPTRYEDKVKFVEKVFKSQGIDEAVAIYITDSRALTRELEERKIDGQSLLHYSSRHLDFLGNVEGTLARDIISKGVEPEILEGVKGKLMEFWKTHPESTNADRGVVFNEIIDNLPVELSKPARRTLVQAISYPDRDREFKAAMNREFPEKEERPRIAEDVKESAKRLALGRSGKDIKEVSTEVKDAYVGKEETKDEKHQVESEELE